MNLTASAILPFAFVASISSSTLPEVALPMYNLNLVQSISDTQKNMTLKGVSAMEQALSLFPESRGFSKEEGLAYKESLSKLFQKTGRTLF